MSITQPGTLNNLVTQIKNDISHCQQLLSLLENERSCLQDKNIEQLESIIEQKNGLLAHLEVSAKTRAALVASLGSQENSQPAERWEKWLDENDHQGIKESWLILKELMEKCREANEINGKIMSRNQQTYSKVLDILRGQPSNTKLYTQQGNKSSTGLGHHLGEA